MPFELHIVSSSRGCGMGRTTPTRSSSPPSICSGNYWQFVAFGMFYGLVIDDAVLEGRKVPFPFLAKFRGCRVQEKEL